MEQRVEKNREKERGGEKNGGEWTRTDLIGSVYVHGSLQSSRDTERWRYLVDGIDARQSWNRINVRDFSSRMYR